MTYNTVRAATAGELTLLRTPGQWSKLFLAIFKPTTVYTARLAALPSSNDRVIEITFDTGAGVLADVLPDMTMYVGSTAGTYDLGMVRIRKAPIAGTFYIGEESDVNWQEDCYLTVVNEIDLWARHINVVDDTTFYMDWDVEYTNQNSVFNPIPIMGSHRVLKLTGASVSTQFNWTNSYVISSTISGYSVACATASSITNGTTGTPTIAFTAEGWHMVVLTVTAANGKTSVGVRYVYVYSDENPPSTVFQLGNCFGDYESGGWSYNVTMQSEVGITEVPDRTLCILFAEDYYGDTNTSIGQLPGCENVICIGKISGESVDFNSEQGEVTLQIQGMQYWLSQTYAFPTGVILTSDIPANWAEMQSPTVDKVLFRLLYWGSNATKVMDIYLTNDTRIASELISPASNLMAQIQELAFATIYANVGVDRYGRMFIEVEPQVVPVASRTWPSVMTVSKSDWHESIRMERVVVTPTGMVNSSGVVVTSGGDGSALFSLAPGHVFKRYGTPEVVDKLLLSTQNLSNQMAALLLGWKNNPYPNNEFQLAANNRMIDCFPRQKVEWALLAGDNPRGFSFTDYFIPRTVELTWDDSSGFLETNIVIERQSAEHPSMNGDIPGDGDVDTSSPPAPPAFPPMPDFPIIIPTDITPPSIPLALVIKDNTHGLLYTFNPGGTGWVFWNNGLTLQQKQAINFFFKTPSGVCYTGYRGGTATTNTPDTFLARAPSVGSDWVIVYDNNNMFGGGGRWGLQGAGYNPLQPDVVGISMQTTADGGPYFWLGTGGTFVKKAQITGEGYFFPLNVVWGNDKWIVTSYGNQGNGGVRLLPADGASMTAAPSQNGNLNPSVISAGSTGTTFHEKVGNGLIIGANNFTTNTDAGDNTLIFSDPVPGCDPSGYYLMTRRGAGARGRSSDGGTTWGDIANLVYNPNWMFRYISGAGTASRWVAAGGTSIMETFNFGTTWAYNEGNLTTLIAVPVIELVEKI